MFVTTLFTTDKTQNQSKCPSTDEWTKMRYIYKQPLPSPSRTPPPTPRGGRRSPSTARGDPAEAGAGAEDTPPPAHGEAGPAEGKERGGGGTGLHRHRRRRPGRPPGRSDKPLCRGLTFNRSQRGSCSATYETPTQKQVVYEWFSTRRPTNVRCVTGEGAAAFPAAPRVPGRRALRTGPRSQLAFCSILALLC